MPSKNGTPCFLGLKKNPFPCEGAGGRIMLVKGTFISSTKTGHWRDVLKKILDVLV